MADRACGQVAFCTAASEFGSVWSAAKPRTAAALASHSLSQLAPLSLLLLFYSATKLLSPQIMTCCLWLRCETKEFERRTALSPSNAKKLIDAGFEIFVERDTQRIFADSEYEA